MRMGWILLAPVAIVAILAFIAVGGAVVMLLWNWLLPPLFGWPAIGFWQALGLLVLCRILFGGWRSHGGARSRVRHRMSRRWRERWAERMASMTDEERERFRHGMRARCVDPPSHDREE